MRERFCKSGQPFNQVGADFRTSLREMFTIFDLTDFNDEISFWLELSLTNGRAAYHEATDREDVMDFCKELIKLVEAFYLISVNKTTNTRRDAVHPAKFKPINNKKRLPVTEQQPESLPVNSILQFRNMFTPAYAELELFDLLDAVITYEGVKQVNRENLVLFYQCVRYLVNHAYTFEKDSEKL